MNEFFIISQFKELFEIEKENEKLALEKYGFNPVQK